MKKIMFFILSIMSGIFLISCDNYKLPSSDITEKEHYEIGDIIFADTSIVKEQELTELDDNNIPIAVIAGFKNDGTTLGIGVHRSDEPLPWTLENTLGYNTKFTNIISLQETSVFVGDIDGSDNWNIICDEDNQDTINDAENYPAFHFMNTYAQNYKLSDEYYYGWYIPSIEELNTIYQNRDAINSSLQKIYNMDNNAAMNGLGTNWYWSSSQANSDSESAWFMHYFNGYAGECPKNFTNLHVIVVHNF